MVTMTSDEKCLTAFTRSVDVTANIDREVCGVRSVEKNTVAPVKRSSPRTQPVQSGLSLLKAEELPLWDGLVDSSPQCSVFFKSWWLKATCKEVRVLGYFEAGRLVAGIPLHYEYLAGLRICRIPKLTQTWGVVIAPLLGKKVTVESRETEILDKFAARLANELVFVQAFHPTSQNWLPFYWHGFSQTTHYTYVLDDLRSIDHLWNDLDQDRRSNIRKARASGITVKECSPEVVFRSARATFAHQGRQCPYSIDYLCGLYDAAHAREAGICLAAQDRVGNVHAAYFFVWDDKRGYFLAGGHDPLLGSSGGSVLLVWNLIEFATAHTAVFDFEGSMRRQIETSFRSFGASRVAYNQISHIPRWLRIGMNALGRPSI